jgi:formylmethanofuran dehydrogenase subunit C
MLTITVKHDSTIPLEFAGILPEHLEALTELEISKRPVLLGNRSVQLGEVATVSLRFSKDDSVYFDGDTDRVKQLGAGMSRGFIMIEGNAGMHTGARMSGGDLIVNGNASDWLGAEMRGGRIKVCGDAGHNVGSAYRGSRHGMRGGAIRVMGNAGDELGLLMRRGTIDVYDSIGDFAGASMIAGTILARRGFGTRAGAGMKRGTLIARGQTEPISSGFRHCCNYDPAYLDILRLLWRQFPTDCGPVRCYRGDVLTGGRGELLVLES